MTLNTTLNSTNLDTLVRIAGDRSNHLIVNRIAKKFSILSMIDSRADGGSVILLAN